MKTNDKNRYMNKESTKLMRSALKNTDKQPQSMTTGDIKNKIPLMLQKKVWNYWSLRNHV